MAIREKVDRLEEALIELAKSQERVDRAIERMSIKVEQTSEEVNRLSKEMDKFKEWSRRQIEENRKGMEEFRKSMEEYKEWSKRQIEENRKGMEEYKEWSKRQIEELRRGIEENRKNMEEFRKSMEEYKEWSKRQIEELRNMTKRMNKQWGELANKLGTLVEDIIAPALPDIVKKYFNCDIDDFMIRRKKKHSKDRSKVREFDVIILCNDTVILDETKSTPRYEYVKEFIEFVKSGEFFEYFPEYIGKKFIAIFSTLNMPKDIIEYLTKSGIYAMGMKGDYMDILNYHEISDSPE